MDDDPTTEKKPLLTQLRGALLLAFAIATLFVLFPLGLGADYLNHLARAYIETAFDGSEALQSFYEIDYKFVPDFTIELFVPRLEPVLGVYGAGALVAAVAAILAPLGGIALSRTLHGGAGGWAALLGFVTVFNRNLEFGFINFLFALGLSLFVFALWVRLDPGWRRTGIIAVAGVIVVANHILGFLFLGYIALLWEVSKFRRGERGDWRQFLFGLTIRDGLAFLPGLALIAYAFVIAEDVSTWSGGVAMFGQRMEALMSGFSFFYSPLASLSAAALLVAIILGLYLGLRRDWITVHPDMAFVCIGVLALVIIMPAHLAGIWGLHLRYGGALLILAAASIRITEKSCAPIAATGFAFIGALLALNGALNLGRINSTLGDLRDVFAGLPEGARVLSATEPEVGFEIGVHGASLAVIEADGYVPNLFTNISAVGVTDKMRALHMPQGKPLLVETLSAHRLTPLPAPENGRWSEAYYYSWPDNYSHLIFFRTGEDAQADLPGLKEIASGPDFVLYEILEDVGL